MSISQKELIYKHLSKPKSLLIVLDACRYDAFVENAFIIKNAKLKILKVISSGSCTKEWLINTFTKPLPDVIYVTANPWVSLVFKENKTFKSIVDLSFKYWDEKFGTVRAEHVNLIALKYMLRGEKLIVHYLQPHPPFVVETWLIDNVSSSELAGSKIYELASRNKSAKEEFRRAYIENLKYVLRNVDKLLKIAYKLGYNVAITSDHGELLGAYSPLKVIKYMFRKNVIKFLEKTLPYILGRKYLIGHPCKWVDKELYEVPWADIYINF